jgi:hypothetical protein
MELNMSMLRQAVSIFLLATLAACGDGGKPEQKPAAAVKQDTRPYLLANDFTNATWKNGVHQKDGKTNVFYYLHRDPGAPALKAGDILDFARTGKATVQNVVPAPANKDGVVSVFVTVDKGLDPAGDGFPNKIYIGQ